MSSSISNARCLLGLLHTYPQASVRSEDMAQLLKARLISRNIELVTLVTGIMKDYRTVSVLVSPTGRVNLE